MANSVHYPRSVFWNLRTHGRRVVRAAVAGLRAASTAARRPSARRPPGGHLRARRPGDGGYAEVRSWVRDRPHDRVSRRHPMKLHRHRPPRRRRVVVGCTDRELRHAWYACARCSAHRLIYSCLADAASSLFAALVCRNACVIYCLAARPGMAQQTLAISIQCVRLCAPASSARKSAMPRSRQA